MALSKWRPAPCTILGNARSKCSRHMVQPLVADQSVSTPPQLREHDGVEKIVVACLHDFPAVGHACILGFQVWWVPSRIQASTCRAKRLSRMGMLSV